MKKFRNLGVPEVLDPTCRRVPEFGIDYVSIRAVLNQVSDFIQLACSGGVVQWPEGAIRRESVRYEGTDDVPSAVKSEHSTIGE